MARTDLTAVEASDAGVSAGFAAANVDGHAFGNNGKRVVLVNNTDASPHTVTIPTPGTIRGLDIPERTYQVAAGDVGVIGPFPTGMYGQPTDDNKVHVDFDAVTGVEVTLVEVDPA